MKIAFFGTPIFSAKVLESLAEQHNVVACITAPDAKSNRGKKLNPPEVKKMANQLELEVYQPAKLDADFLEEFKKFNLDVAVVVSYGRIIPESYLNIPKYGFINIHASILPRWRGAAPIHRAILAGDKETGISIMQMDKGLDTGDVFSILKCDIEETETTGTLHDKLLDLGIKGILDFLAKLEEADKAGSGFLTAQKQDDTKANYAHKIDKKMATIDWSNDGIELERLIRGLNPYPSAKASFNGDLLKIHMANFIEAEHNLDFGVVESSSEDGIKVACQNGFINITKIQRAGSKAMPVKDFLRGKKIAKGDKLV